MKIRKQWSFVIKSFPDLYHVILQKENVDVFLVPISNAFKNVRDHEIIL